MLLVLFIGVACLIVNSTSNEPSFSAGPHPSGQGRLAMIWIPGPVVIKKDDEPLLKSEGAYVYASLNTGGLVCTRLVERKCLYLGQMRQVD
jgi:hypothetical protein